MSLIKNPEELSVGQVIIVQAKQNLMNGNRQQPEVMTIRKSQGGILVIGVDRIPIDRNFLSKYFLWKVDVIIS